MYAKSTLGSPYGEAAMQGQISTREAEGMRNANAPRVQPSVMTSCERLHAALERIKQSISSMESHLAPLTVSMPESSEKDHPSEITGIALVDMIDDATRRALALAQRLDNLGQRTAI